MNVGCKIKIKELDGKAVYGDSELPLVVESHNSYNDYIVLSFGGKEVAVTIADLERAIKAVKCSE